MKGADIDQLIGWIRNWGLAYVTGLGDIFLLHGRSIPDGMILHPEARPCMCRLKHLDRKFGKDRGKENRGGAAL